jgi:hypothetical protein
MEHRLKINASSTSTSEEESSDSIDRFHLHHHFPYPRCDGPSYLPACKLFLCCPSGRSELMCCAKTLVWGYLNMYSTGMGRVSYVIYASVCGWVASKISIELLREQFFVNYLIAKFSLILKNEKNIPRGSFD